LRLTLGIHNTADEINYTVKTLIDITRNLVALESGFMPTHA